MSCERHTNQGSSHHHFVQPLALTLDPDGEDLSIFSREKKPSRASWGPKPPGDISALAQTIIQSTGGLRQLVQQTSNRISNDASSANGQYRHRLIHAAQAAQAALESLTRWLRNLEIISRVDARNLPIKTDCLGNAVDQGLWKEISDSPPHSWLLLDLFSVAR